jgi:hypothetical protein
MLYYSNTSYFYLIFVIFVFLAVQNDRSPRSLRLCVKLFAVSVIILGIRLSC